MQISKMLRRYLAAICAVLILACQGMAVVYARAAGPAVPGAAAQETCHNIDHLTTGDKFKGTCRANCETQHVSSTPSGAYVYAAAGLPSISVPGRVIVASDTSPAPVPPPMRVEPPPHAILHCCLRN